METSLPHINAYDYVKQLYEVNNEFHQNIQESTHFALISLKNGREKTAPDSGEDTEIVLEEGVKYLLKELAFLSAVSDIYDNCEEFVFVYHRPWPVLEKYFDGRYDNIAKPCLGFYVLQ